MLAMNLCWTLVLLVSCMMSLSPVHDVDCDPGSSDDYDTFKAKHKKPGKNKDKHHEKRAARFAKHQDFVKAHNSKHATGEVTYTVALNNLSDLLDNELDGLRGAASLTSLPVPVQTSRKRRGDFWAEWTNCSYPTATKLRMSNASNASCLDQACVVSEQNYRSRAYKCAPLYTPLVITASDPNNASIDNRPFLDPPEEQGALHAAYAVKNRTRVHISRQMIVECMRNNTRVRWWNEQVLCETNGCDGCYKDIALAYIVKYGVLTEAIYQYKTVDGFTQGSCRAHHGDIKPTGMVVVPKQSEELMRRAVAKYGACMVEINCTEKPGFINYNSGVFTSPSGETLHAVAVVGYGQYNNTNMWIVRNSWSANWGMGGYILMKRGNNTCGIADAVTCPVV